MLTGRFSNMSDDKSGKTQSPICPYCQRRFRTLDDLTFHVVTRHTQSGKSAPGPAQAGSGGKN